MPYGRDISTTGKWVYYAYDDERLVAVAATAPEARRKYQKVWAKDYNAHSLLTSLIDAVTYRWLVKMLPINT